jgi:hypothetical protein
LGQAEAFKFMTELWDEYNPDRALLKSRIKLRKYKKIRSKKYLKALKKAYGYDAFLTCDGATGTKLSTVSLCVSTETKAVTKCPKKVLKQYRKRCPKKMIVERGNGSLKKPTSQCAKYYK